MSKILNLDNYNQNMTITFNGQEYTIPPITVKTRETIMVIIEKVAEDPNLSSQEKRGMDVELLAAYLNTNLNGIKLSKEELEALNTYQIKALTEFIVEQIQGIEKN